MSCCCAPGSVSKIVTTDRFHNLRARAPALIAVLLLLCQASVCAGEPPVSDVKVRAAFLLNVAKFVQWPAGPAPLVLGVAGDAPLASALALAATGRKIEGRPLTVRIITDGERPDGCDLLYIGAGDDREASALLARVRGPVLTVGSTMRFLRDGGIIRIFIEADRLRFQVNRRRAVESGLQISSQLLSLAAQ